jgi:hypothetical protein
VADKLHVGDVGAVFTATLLKTDGTVYTLTLADVVEFVFLSPGDWRNTSIVTFVVEANL